MTEDTKGLLVVIFILIVVYFSLRAIGCDMDWLIPDYGNNPESHEPRDWFRGL